MCTFFLLFLGSVGGCRKSSGFSRGASVYRGVTRYGHKKKSSGLYEHLFINNFDKVFPLYLLQSQLFN